MEFSGIRPGAYNLEQAKLNSPDWTSDGVVEISQPEVQDICAQQMVEQQNQVAEPLARLRNLLTQAGLPVSEENLQLLEMMMAEKIQLTIPKLKELSRTLQNMGIVNQDSVKAAVFLAARSCPINLENLKLANILIQDSGLGKLLGELLDKSTLADLPDNQITVQNNADSVEISNYERFLLTTLKDLLPLKTQNNSNSPTETLLIKLKEQLQTTGEVWQAKGLFEKMLAGISKASGLQDLVAARELIQGFHQKADADFITYIPIPITNGEQFRSGELYVWERKPKSDRNDDEESSLHILFLLNTSGLGNWRIDLVARGENLSLNIVVNEEHVNKVVKSNLATLEQKIEELGFAVNHLNCQVANEPDRNKQLHDKKVNITSNNRVDVRV